MKESDIQKKIIDHLHSVGAWTVKTIRCNKSGVPDILACLNGKFISLEVKTDIGKTSPIQDRCIKQIKAAGGISAIVRSVDETKQILKELLNER